MAYSYIRPIYTGGPQVFDTNFALGVLDTEDIKVRIDGVGTEVSPVYLDFTYNPSTGLLTVLDDISALHGLPAVMDIRRVTPITTYEVNFQSPATGTTKRNLQRMAAQTLMSVQELADALDALFDSNGYIRTRYLPFATDAEAVAGAAKDKIISPYTLNVARPVVPYAITGQGHNGFVNAADFGVIYDGYMSLDTQRWMGTDNTAAVQAAVDWCSPRRLKLVFSGPCRFGNVVGKNMYNLRPAPWVWFVCTGAGALLGDYDPDATHDGNHFHGQSLFKSPEWNLITSDAQVVWKPLFKMENVTYHGLWDKHPKERAQQFCELIGYERIELLHCWMDNNAGQLVKCDYVKSALLDGGYYKNITGGSVLRLRYADNIKAVNYTVDGTGDDAFDCHATDGSPNNDGTHTPTTMHFANGKHINARGQVLLGATDIIISHMSYERCYGAISILGTNVEGQGVIRNITISDVHILDPMRRGDFPVGAHDDNVLPPTAFYMESQRCISIGNVIPAGDGVKPAPMNWYAAENRFITPYEAMAGQNAGPSWARDTRGSGKAGAPAASIKIHHVTIERTLPNAAHYGDWGFGLPFHAYQDGTYNPAVNASSFCHTGIYLVGPMVDVSIDHVTIKNLTEMTAIHFDPNAGLSRAFTRIVMDNLNINGVKRGIARSPANDDPIGDGMAEPDTWDVTIRDSSFIGDWSRVQPNRIKATGGWTGPSNYEYAIGFPGIAGIRLENCTFGEWSRCLRGDGSEAGWYMRGNTILGEMQQIEFSSSNIGVGMGIDRPQSEVIYLDAEVDPTTGIYGTIKAMPLSESDAVPAAGPFYRRSHFVPVKTATIASGKVLTGHMCLTSGRGGSATWTPLYATNS